MGKICGELSGIYVRTTDVGDADMVVAATHTVVESARMSSLDTSLSLTVDQARLLRDRLDEAIEVIEGGDQ